MYCLGYVWGHAAHLGTARGCTLSLGLLAHFTHPSEAVAFVAEEEGSHLQMLSCEDSVCNRKTSEANQTAGQPEEKKIWTAFRSS